MALFDRFHHKLDLIHAIIGCIRAEGLRNESLLMQLAADTRDMRCHLASLDERLRLVQLHLERTDRERP